MGTQKCGALMIQHFGTPIRALMIQHFGGHYGHSKVWGTHDSTLWWALWALKKCGALMGIQKCGALKVFALSKCLSKCLHQHGITPFFPKQLDRSSTSQKPWPVWPKEGNVAKPAINAFVQECSHYYPLPKIKYEKKGFGG